MNGYGLARRWRHGWRTVGRVDCPECHQSLPLNRVVRDLHLLRAHGWKRTAWHVHRIRPARQMERA